MVEKKWGFKADPHADLNLASDIKGIISIVHQLWEKVEKDKQKLNKEKIGRESTKLQFCRSTRIHGLSQMQVEALQRVGFLGVAQETVHRRYLGQPHAHPPSDVVPEHLASKDNQGQSSQSAPVLYEQLREAMRAELVEQLTTTVTQQVTATITQQVTMKMREERLARR